MPETAIITPLHVLYLAGVIAVLTVMILRLDTPAVCIAFLFLIGAAGLHSVVGGIQTVFNAILYAAREFMEIIATIALVTALSKVLGDLGSDRLLMAPMSRIMKTPALTWWILGLSMFLFSLFLWPSPSVALVGAIMLPFAVRSGLSPLAAAMAMNLFGHGFALSYDAVIQGAPAVSAAAAGITSADILCEGRPVFLIMGGVTVCSAFFISQKRLRAGSLPLNGGGVPSSGAGTSVTSIASGNGSDKSQSQPPLQSSLKEAKNSRAAGILAAAVPAAFLADIVLMAALGLNGEEATSIVSGTAVLLMCLGSVLGFGKRSLENITRYLTEGFLFAIRIFSPVIVIGAFFFLGGSGISVILGNEFETGILNDWAVWLAAHAPLNSYGAAALQLFIGALTGLDGSGFSGLPLTGALARTFGTATGASVPVLAALGQIAAIFVGGGTIVPWGIVPVAAICGVSPTELAARNLLPVCIGFLSAFVAACFLL